MLALRDCPFRCYVPALDPEEVIYKSCLSSLCIKGPTAKFATLTQYHAFSASVRTHDFRRDGERFIFDVQDSILLQAPHAGKQHLRFTFDQFGAAGEIRVEPLHAAVVERQDIVLYGFDQ